MKIAFRGLVAALGISAAIAAPAQAPAPILYNSFDESDGGWTATGVNARASVNRQTTWNGTGALKFEYDVKKGAMSALMLPTPDGKLAKGRALRFWVNSDYATPIAVILQEKSGARYWAPFAAPKGKWQKVELGATDFTLMEGLGSPPDPDGKLDMDDVRAIAVGDIAQFFGMIGDPNVEKLLGAQTGAHAVYLDDFSVTDETLATTVVVGSGGVVIDTFARPQACWLCLGGPTMTVTGGAGGAARVLQIDYRQGPSRLIGMLRPVPKGKLQGMTRLSMTVAAKRSFPMMVQVEESGGGKFDTTVDPPSDGSAKTIVVDFDSMNPADDSKVKDRKVKPELITQVMIVDPMGLIGLTTEVDNTLWISDLKALPAK